MKPLPTYRVLRSRRRTLALEVTPAAELLVRAPMNTPNAYIESFVRARQDWAEAHIAKVLARRAAAEAVPRLKDAELKELRERAKAVFEARADHFAPLLGARPGRITVRFQRRRWGSCSARGNLSFNGLLLLAPPEVLDYVVIHELCHLKEMNHSPRFWAAVAGLMPEWKERRLWLRKQGAQLMARLPE